MFFVRSNILRNSYKIVYTDGACSNNGYSNAKSAIGVFFGKDDARNVSRSVETTRKHTNQRAELLAAIEALKIEQNCALEIRSDSRYFVRGVHEWLTRWKLLNYVVDGKRIANVDLWRQIDQMIEDRNVKNIPLRVVWVKAHENCEGNQKADELARKGLI